MSDCFKRKSLDSKRLAKRSSGVLLFLRRISNTFSNELTDRWMLRGTNLILTVDSNTVFAPKGSRKILNSAYLFEGMVKTFPLSVSSSLICPPTI